MQQQDQGSLENHLESSNGVLISDGSALGTNSNSLVGFADRRSSSGGGEIDRVENGLMRDGSLEVFGGVETVGGLTDCQFIGDGSTGVLTDTHDREGSLSGDAQEDGMEFYGGGGASTSG